MASSQFRFSLKKLLVTLWWCTVWATTVVDVADAFLTDSGSVSVQKAQAKTKTKTIEDRKKKYDQLRHEWREKSISYYSKVSREERRRKAGQINSDVFVSEEYQQNFEVLAKKHYFALRKIKEGRYHHAEIIYERLIREIMEEDKDGHSCDHAKLAVTTLLLALHCQRVGKLGKARSVFLDFVQLVTKTDTTQETNGDGDGDHESSEDLTTGHDVTQYDQCICSAKVLCAFALFEMKHGNPVKSLEIARMAVAFDESMAPLLEWKQFRDVRMGMKA
eukprot:jgi/Psemu1/306158/fgenesh1_kg.238_\